MATIETPAGFYILRFLLGVAEAGFFPGIILFLTYWYPAERRGRIIALFMAAIPVSGLIGSPLSGWILDAFPGVLGYAGWQWLFVLEAVPSCVLGLVAFFYLTDHPSQAKWLTTEEAKSMEMDLAEEAAHHDSQSIKSAFTDWRVWLLSVTYFFIQTGVYAIAFWLPTLIKAGGFSSSLMVGLVSAIPWGAATIFVILMGRSADATGKRRLHVIIPVVLGSVGLLGSAFFAGNFPVAVFCLTLATMGCLAALTLFWSMPSAFLGGFGAATGLAVINSMGNVAGFASPYAVGLIRDATHSTTAALYVLSGTVLAAAFLITRVPASVDR